MKPYEQMYDRVRADAAFAKEMEGRQYGPEERADAEAWFIAGWMAAMARVPDCKEKRHGRDFFQGEGQEISDAEVRGWNQFRYELLK